MRMSGDFMFNKINLTGLFPAGLVLLTLSLFSSLSHALESDRSQPISIQANQAEFNPETGIATYTGAVEMIQGSLKVNAHSVTIHQDSNGEVSKIIAIAKDKRVHLRQQPSPDSPEVHAFAMYAEYLAAEQEVLLKEQAQIENGQDQFTGKRIRYNLQTRNIRAWGDDTQDTSQQPGQVKIILYPKNSQDTAQ